MIKADQNTSPKKYDGTPAFLCFLFEWGITFVGLNHMVGGLPIALARLYYLFQGSKLTSYIKVRDVQDLTRSLIKRIKYANLICSDDLDLSIQGGHLLENPLLVLSGTLCSAGDNERGREPGLLGRKELLVSLQVLNKITKNTIYVQGN